MLFKKEAGVNVLTGTLHKLCDIHPICIARHCMKLPIEIFRCVLCKKCVLLFCSICDRA